MSPTSAWVVWAPLVAGGEPRRAEPIRGCNPPLVCEASCWWLSRMVLSGCNMSSLLGGKHSTRVIYLKLWYLDYYVELPCLKSLVVRQLVYTMSIANNYDSFHLWWHENFVKHQNVSKYYDQDCSLLKWNIPF